MSKRPFCRPFVQGALYKGRVDAPHPISTRQDVKRAQNLLPGATPLAFALLDITLMFVINTFQPGKLTSLKIQIIILFILLIAGDFMMRY